MHPHSARKRSLPISHRREYLDVQEWGWQGRLPDICPISGRLRRRLRKIVTWIKITASPIPQTAVHLRKGLKKECISSSNGRIRSELEQAKQKCLRIYELMLIPPITQFWFPSEFSGWAWTGGHHLRHAKSSPISIALPIFFRVEWAVYQHLAISITNDLTRTTMVAWAIVASIFPREVEDKIRSSPQPLPFGVSPDFRIELVRSQAFCPFNNQCSSPRRPSRIWAIVVKIFAQVKDKIVSRAPSVRRLSRFSG